MNNNPNSSQSPPPTTVPHVVRVTFLGVAGIYYNGSRENKNDPAPSRLCVAAAISRTRTARGIPSGPSGRLRRVHRAAPPRTAAAAVEPTPPSRLIHRGNGSNIHNSNVDNSIEVTDGTEMTGLPLAPTSSDDTAQGDKEPGRYVAVWNDVNANAPGSNQKRDMPTPRARPKSNNTLAFEAELHPSDNNGGNTKFAPKTFCVTVGLCIDSNNNDFTDSGDWNDDNSFAIPIGFANLIITGEETLDGQPLQIDLPLMKTQHLTVGKSFEKDFPLLDLGSGTATTASNSGGGTRQYTGGEQCSNTGGGGGKQKKKSMVSRIFSRAKGSTTATNTTTASHDITEGNTGYNSIFQQGRIPASIERRQFLESFNIDPSGDAILRIGLEVFERGSELECIFRRRNRLRRERKRAEASRATAAAAAATKNSVANSRSFGSAGKSLIDDEEEAPSEESNSDDDEDDYDSSYFSLDSEASGTTWEDSSTIYTSETVDTFYTTKSSEKVPSKLQFGKRMFDCKMNGEKVLEEENEEETAVVPIQLPGIFSCGHHLVKSLYDQDDTNKVGNFVAVPVLEGTSRGGGETPEEMTEGVELGSDEAIIVIETTTLTNDKDARVAMTEDLSPRMTCEQVDPQMEGLELTLDDVRIS